MEVLPKIFADLWIHRENGIRAIQDGSRDLIKVLGREVKIFQNSTVGDRSLSDGKGNRTIVPKGACGLSPKGMKHGARMRGEVYSLLN